MLLDKNAHKETLYDVLNVKEDASYEEIRARYRSAVLNLHPDKLLKTSEMSSSHQTSGDRFLTVQKAWEILSNSTSRSTYDNELRGSRQDALAADVAEDVSLQDMIVEQAGEALDLSYQCRCGDYFTIDSTELEKMGYSLLRDGSEISLRTVDSLPGSVILPCGSCSLKVRLLINMDESN
ncbi:diphthamide biosynthesis protein 4 [Neltuma alba]|uniref:diphthamide biosynthesis protein 4 n=1 Tax=Neltuma alba TaxID=207710 RepID=UPI0010A2C0EC|nr:diphthamide biosynthesis protein 4 [Prosopis alba]